MKWTTTCALLLTAVLAADVAAQTQRGQNRQRQRRAGSQEHLITRDMVRAVERGLAYLAAQQNDDGSWSQKVGFKLNTDYRMTKQGVAHVGVSSLALMSFLAGGHMPGRGKYGKVLTKGLDYILSCVRENGFIADHGSRMYSHAFATLLLAEIYGMTRRRDVRRALQKSTTVIVDSQNAEGGWRYQLFARESDMSITVCQVMALRAARNVGITVPVTTIRRAENYVKNSAITGDQRGSHYHFGSHGIVNAGGAFRYQLRHASRATFPLTAAGVTTLYAAGSYDSRLIPDALEYLREQMPRFNSMFGREGHYFFYYGHYYAVQAFFIAGGDHWNRYFRRIRAELLRNQQADGSWPCQIGPGEVFSTAVSTLVLQIPYQYLPIFQR